MPGWLSKTGAFCARNTILRTTANLSKYGAPERAQRPEATGKFGDVQIVGIATIRMRDPLTWCRSTTQASRSPLAAHKCPNTTAARTAKDAIAVRPFIHSQ